MNQQQIEKQTESNTLLRIIKTSLLDSSLIIQLKLLRYTSKKINIEKEIPIIEKLLFELKVEKTNLLQIFNLNIIIKYFNKYKLKNNYEIKDKLSSLNKFHLDNKFNKSNEEFLIICNLIETCFSNVEQVELKDLIYLENCLLDFDKSNQIMNYSLFDKHFTTYKRHNEIPYQLIYFYYEIIIKYLIMIKEKKINNNSLMMKITLFIVTLQKK